MLQAPPEFMLVVSYNPGYQSILKDLKPSTRQRFVSFDFGYPPPDIEGEVEKGGHKHWMSKEIAEQPDAVSDTLLGHFVDNRIVLDEQRLSDQELRDIDKVFVVACGTTYHSGMLAKYAIEHWTRLPVEVELASEFRYRDPVLDRSTLVVAISQSGETADTLEAVRHAKDQKARVLAICNTNGAQIPRESDAVLYTHAGPEIGVASTKCFLAQIVAAYLGALESGGERVDALIELAAFQAGQGRRDESIGLYDRATRADPARYLPPGVGAHSRWSSA